MDFVDIVKEFEGTVSTVMDDVAGNEEATKTSLVMPFLNNVLGYNVFNPRIVTPEFTADIGTKKGEKVDYAIFQDGEPIMLVEVKPCGQELNAGQASQLHRYFHNVQSAKVGILTNGVIYEFYSDLDSANIMDNRPFMVLNMADVEDSLIPEIKKLASGNFDPDLALGAAQNLKYSREIKRLINNEFGDPSPEFIKYFASKVYDGVMRSHVVDEFKPRLKRAFQDFINDQINERLEIAMHRGPYEETEAEDLPQEKPRIVTTEDEQQAFYMVKAILRGSVDAARVFMRDTQSYCGVLLDDNNRKPICRLYFNTANYQVGTFDGDKKETKHSIGSIDDILGLADELRAAALSYDQ